MSLSSPPSQDFDLLVENNTAGISMTTDTEEIVKRVRAVTKQYLGTSDVTFDAMTTSLGVLARLTDLGRITEVQRNAAAEIIDPKRRLSDSSGAA